MRTRRILAALAAGSFALIAFRGTAVAANPEPRLRSAEFTTDEQCRAGGGVPRQSQIWGGPAMYVGGTYNGYIVVD
ncbi:hypothetical protein ACWENS_09865 [Streptomyces sp. NPDC004532]